MSITDKLHDIKKKAFVGGLISLGSLVSLNANAENGNNNELSDNVSKKEIKIKLKDMGLGGKHINKAADVIHDNWDNMKTRDSQKDDSLAMKKVKVEELSWSKDCAEYLDLTFGEILDKIPVKDTNKDFTAGYASINDYYMATAHQLGLKEDAKLLPLDIENQGKKGKYTIVEASNGIAILSDDGKTAVAGVIKDYKMNYVWVQPDNVVAPCDGYSNCMFPIDVAASFVGERDYDPVKMGTRETNYAFYAAQRSVKSKNNEQKVSNTFVGKATQHTKE